MSSKEQCVRQALLCDLALSVLQDQFPFQHVNEEQNNSMGVPDHDVLVQADKESILALTDDEEDQS